MARFVLRRLLWMIPVLLAVILVTFLLMHAAPGGPWDRDPGRRQVDPATEEMLNKKFGLDKPLWRQFLAYTFADWDYEGKFVCGAACGNLGPSYRQRGRTVQEILFSVPEDRPFWRSRFGYSARLGLLALSFAILVGVPSGIVAALKQNTWIDYLSALIANFGVSVPSFVIAIYLIIIFGVQLHWVSVVPRSWASPKAWIIPALVLGFGTMAFTARLTRSSMLEVMRQDYVRTARAKGLKERVVVFEHALKNALLPVVTVIGGWLAGLLGGAILTETVFSWPGMGTWTYRAILGRDYPIVQGSVLVSATIYVFVNLAVDVLYAFIDPRIRYD